MSSRQSTKTSHFYAIPRTSMGIWGLGLMVGTTLIIILMSSLILVMNRTVMDPGTGLGLGVANVAYIVAILTGIVLSWIALFAKKDRSIILIVAASLFTVLAVIFGVGEFLLPH